MKLYQILIALLFFVLPLVHGKLLPTLGFDISLNVAWNFEFTKALFFNIASSLIFLSYVVRKNALERIHIWYIEASVFLILIISTIFSLSPFMSLIWDLEKGHRAIMLVNLLWLYSILKHEKRVYLEKLIYISLYSFWLVCLLGMKELVYPTYDYGELWNRMLWSFGHPNYLAWYTLLMLPYITLLKNHVFKYLAYILIWVSLVLTQSIVALFLVFNYLSYIASNNMQLVPSPLRRGLGWGMIWGVCLAWFTITMLYFPEKLHSFLSRFYLWETTLKIIFSDYKMFLFGWWLETLPYFFDSFKSPELYIYENYGYTADRPHNFFLNIFYHFWIFWIILFWYLICQFFLSLCKREYPKGEGLLSPHQFSISLFLLFWVFHYFSIASYLIVILWLAFIYKWLQENYHNKKCFRIHSRSFIILLMLISCIWGYTSLQLYRAELYISDKKYVSAREIFPHPKYFRISSDYENSLRYEKITSPELLKHQIRNTPNKQELCETLVIRYPAVEHYFYCGEIFESLWNTDISKQYYASWLEKLPDLWNPDSPYWDNYLIKNTITWNRFFSKKFGDIRSILKKVEKYNPTK